MNRYSLPVALQLIDSIQHPLLKDLLCRHMTKQASEAYILEHGPIVCGQFEVDPWILKALDSQETEITFEEKVTSFKLVISDKDL